MRIQLASDLHLEFLERRFPGERLIAPAADADVLILAGDIANGVHGLELFADWPVPVVYVLGNHEGYGHGWRELIGHARRVAQGTAVHFLEEQSIEIEGVRFLGATLWTDYRLRTNRTQRRMMDAAETQLHDHRLIRNGADFFSTADALAVHERSRQWLSLRLNEPFCGSTVVVTHHAPSRLSVHPRFGMEPLNAAFASELDELVSCANLWVHGHVHDSFDYRLNGCRVVANPRGYAINQHVAGDVSGLQFENADFRAACVIDV